MAPRITVAVCTWNRAKPLERALESIVMAVDALRRSVQLIVVNNNCTADTGKVIERVSRHIALTHVHELRPGLANARNAATQSANGDYIVWTDDDDVMSTRWLEAYANAFVEHPCAVFYGGPIRPVFERAPPAWLAASWEQVAWIYARRDLGGCPFQISRRGDLPFGANFAIKTDLQRKIGYDSRFGRQPNDYWRGGDETEVLARLLDEGSEGWWVPAAEVLHCIPQERQTLSYVAKYAFGDGRVQALRQPATGRWPLLGCPAWVRGQWAKAMARVGFAVATGGPEKWLPAVYRAAEIGGVLYAATRRGR